MTYKQRMEIDNPLFINEKKLGGVYRCPFIYGYDTKENSMKNCTFNNGKGCEYCWNREEEVDLSVAEDLMGL